MRGKRFRPSEYKPVILAVAEEHHIDVADLLGTNRSKRLAAVRKLVAVKLRAMGMPLSQIADAINRDISTINFYVYPSRQAREKRRREARSAAAGPRKPKPKAPIPCRFAPDVMEWIEAQAKAEQVRPEIIIRERMRELAEAEKAARAVS